MLKDLRVFFKETLISAVVLYKYIALPIRLLFCTSLYLLGSLLAAQLSPATQTQQFFAMLGVFFFFFAINCLSFLWQILIMQKEKQPRQVFKAT